VFYDPHFRSFSYSSLQEFYNRCRSSYDLISGQIAWATSNAEKSRIARDEERARAESNVNGANNKQNLNPPELNGDRGGSRGGSREGSPTTPEEQTMEEALLASLLSANAELLEVINAYVDIERVATERRVELLSKKDVRMDRRVSCPVYCCNS
jgi:hypothetical protein